MDQSIGKRIRACRQLILQSFRKLLVIFAMARALLLIQVCLRARHTDKDELCPRKAAAKPLRNPWSIN
jgi:hypothetical protein